MVAGDVRVADLLDTAHHEIDNVVCGHHVYKSVQLPVIRRRTFHPGEGVR